jgi:hypothetical protein
MLENFFVVVLGTFLILALAALVVSAFKPAGQIPSEPARQFRSGSKEVAPIEVQLDVRDRPGTVAKEVDTSGRQMAAVHARFEALYYQNEEELQAARDRHRKLKENLIDGLEATSGDRAKLTTMHGKVVGEWQNFETDTTMEIVR